MPTVLDLVGVDIPREVQARSMVPLIEGGRRQKRLYCHFTSIREPKSITWIVTQAHKDYAVY